MIRIATIALAVVMLSTCAITSIVAGYSVEDSCEVVATQSAFNVTVAITEGTGNDLVLVPGGTGTLATVSVSGEPSVAAATTYTVTTFAIEGFTDAYCPISITVDGTEYKFNDAITTVDALEAAVIAAIEALDGDYAADEFAISWKWTAGDNDNTITEGKITLNMTATIAQK